MDAQLLEEVLACPSLPSLPAVAARVLELTQNPDVSMAELASTIQNDQGLTAKILRTVNSSFYGLTTKCGSIHKALVLLGLGPVKSLVLGFSLVESVGRKGAEGDPFDYQSHWMRGLYSAVMAKLVLHAKGVEGEDEAFVAGLLQDVGSVAMHRAIPKKYGPVLAASEGDHRKLLKAELEVLEVQHPDVGSMLAKRWKLPDELIMAVKYHERPTAAPQEWGTITRAVALGTIGYEVLTSAERATALKRFYDRANSWFALSNETCDQLIAELATSAKGLAAIFRVSAAEVVNAPDLLMQAQQQMAELASAEAQNTASTVEFAGLVIGSDSKDPLTGLMAKGAFENVIEHGYTKAVQQNECTSLLLVHIDQYGSVRTERGIDAADEVLVSTAALLRKHFESRGGALCRWASDTFGIVTVGVPRRDIEASSDEFCKDLVESSSRWRVKPTESPLPVTVSIGGAVMEPDTFRFFSMPDTLRVAALRAIGQSRKGGGNRVSFFGQTKAA